MPTERAPRLRERDGHATAPDRGRSAAALLAWAALFLAARWAARRLAPPPSLEGHVALVTGGSRGLGYLLAERLLDEGCRVAICARDAEDLERARARLSERHERNGRNLLTWTCDVSDAAAVERMVAGVEERIGAIDVLVNNASIIEVAPLEILDVASFRRAIDIDYMGTVHATLAVLPGMRARRYGRICNITSIGGKVAVPHLLPYDAAKFAAVGFSEGLRAEVAKDGITVTTVVPGLMRTGSPTRVDYAGTPEHEYRWFTLGDLLPLSAMSAERAADRIVLAIRRSEGEVVLSWQAKMLRLAHDVAPNATTRAMGWIDRVLPESEGRRAHGSELRGALPEVAERALDRAAWRTNQE